MKKPDYTKTFAFTLFASIIYSNFLLAQAPTISSFSPQTGHRGKSITITGTNFNTSASGNIVYFGATKAVVSTASATQLVVQVPTGATCKPITVLNTTTGLSTVTNKPFIVTLPPYNGYDFSGASFNGAAAANQGTLLRGIAVADFDGDGKADIAGYSGNAAIGISVSRNTSTTSTVSFAAKLDFPLPTGSTTRLITTGDIDNDGKIDIVVGSTTAALKGLYVFRNTSAAPGSIGFTRIDFIADNNLNGLAVGDLDGDGKPEIAASNATGGLVTVYKNTSTPGNLTSSSLTRTNFAANTSVGGIAIGDIDGDNKPELVAADHSGSNLSIYRNTTTPGVIDASSFAAKVDYDLGFAGTHYTVSLADFDGDGKLDIMVPQGTASSVAVFRNTGSVGSITSSSLGARLDLSLSVSSFGGEVADIDGDGKQDILALASSKVVIFRNNASSGSLTAASFATGVEYTVDGGSGSSPNALAIGDINSDGKLDLIPSIPTSPYSFTVALNALNTTLPLRLLSFKATVVNNAVETEWLVGTEDDTKTFYVERSANGQLWQNIGSVASRSSSGDRTYMFLDAAPLDGTNYYRLRCLGNPGAITYSTVLKLDRQKAVAKAVLFPNPINGNSASLQLSELAKGSYQIAVYAATGQQVLQKAIQHDGRTGVTTLSLPDNLSKGVYHVILTGKDFWFTTQLIKE